MTPQALDALISAAGMTAFAEDCDRPAFAKRMDSRRDLASDDSDTLDRASLGL